MTTFFVPGIPVAQPRVKAARIGKFIRIYTPKVADNWKRSVGLIFKQFKTGIHEGPVEVNLRFLMPRPKSHFNKKGLKPLAEVWCAKKPDVDNLAKGVYDALTDAGAWTDDSLVVRGYIEKVYANCDGDCGCAITISALP